MSYQVLILFCRISDATLDTFEIKENDHLIVATDGFIDNLYDEELVDELEDMHVSCLRKRILKCCINNLPSIISGNSSKLQY